MVGGRGGTIFNPLRRPTERNSQDLYRDRAAVWWDLSLRPQRCMAGLVRPRLACMDRVAPVWGEVSVLDLGCGGGFLSEELARRGARVTGVDPCSPLIDAARRHSEASGLEIDYRVGSGEAIPIGNASVDRVVCMDVLEHVEDPDRVLHECRRVLRSGGLFFFSTVNRTRLSRLLVVTLAEGALGMICRGTHDPAKFIRPEEMRALLERNGFAPAAAFKGLGPVGIDRHLDFVMGAFPVASIMYVGHAACR
jgi:2-polyprenyl-6-hydroxyphenyl methylase/3-demethylubiquinone-9 3-methyltransferase